MTDIITKPVPDSSYEVARRNLEDLDKLENQSSGTFQNRAGKVITPIPVVNDRLEELTSSLESLEQEFVDGIASTGYFPVAGSFETGGTITARNQYLQLITTVGSDLAGGYTWGGAIPEGGLVIPAGSTPSSTGGQSANAWVWRSDATVRSDLANGTADVGGAKASDLAKATINVPNLKALASIPVGERRPGITYHVVEFDDGTGIGGHPVRWNPTREWASDEIGLVWPDSAINGYASGNKATLYTDYGIGTGCFEKLFFKKSLVFSAMLGSEQISVPVETFGAAVGVDSSIAVQAGINCLYKLGMGELLFGDGKYLLTNIELKSGTQLNGAGWSRDKGVGVDRQIGTLIENSAPNTTPLFKALGTTNADPEITYYPVSRCKIKNMRLRGAAGNQRLVDLTACTEWIIENVLFALTSNSGLRLHQVYDSRIIDCRFESCGSNGGQPATKLVSGSGYEFTNQIHFIGTVWESNLGLDMDTEGSNNNELYFVNCKMESGDGTTRRARFSNCRGIHFSPLQIFGRGEFGITIPELILFDNCDSVTGALHVETNGALPPEEMSDFTHYVGFTGAAENIDLAVVSYAGKLPTSGFLVKGPSSRLNFNVRGGFYDPSIMLVDGENQLPRYSGSHVISTKNTEPSQTFKRDDLPAESWQVGRIIADSTGSSFRMFHNGTLVYSVGNSNELYPRSGLRVASEWNSGNLLRMGNYRFTVDSSGRVVFNNGVPTSDASGTALQSITSVATALRPASPRKGQMVYDDDLNIPIWWSGSQWTDSQNNPV